MPAPRATMFLSAPPSSNPGHVAAGVDPEAAGEQYRLGLLGGLPRFPGDDRRRRLPLHDFLGQVGAGKGADAGVQGLRQLLRQCLGHPQCRRQLKALGGAHHHRVTAQVRGNPAGVLPETVGRNGDDGEGRAIERLGRIGGDAQDRRESLARQEAGVLAGRLQPLPLRRVAGQQRNRASFTRPAPEPAWFPRWLRRPRPFFPARKVLLEGKLRDGHPRSGGSRERRPTVIVQEWRGRQSCARCLVSGAGCCPGAAR